MSEVSGAEMSDRDRWNEEAAYEAGLQADQDWADAQADADWAADLEEWGE